MQNTLVYFPAARICGSFFLLVVFWLYPLKGEEPEGPNDPELEAILDVIKQTPENENPLKRLNNRQRGRLNLLTSEFLDVLQRVTLQMKESIDHANPEEMQEEIMYRRNSFSKFVDALKQSLIAVPQNLHDEGLLTDLAVLGEPFRVLWQGKELAQDEVLRWWRQILFELNFYRLMRRYRKPITIHGIGLVINGIVGTLVEHILLPAYFIVKYPIGQALVKIGSVSPIPIKGIPIAIHLGIILFKDRIRLANELGIGSLFTLDRIRMRLFGLSFFHVPMTLPDNMEPANLPVNLLHSFPKDTSGRAMMSDSELVKLVEKHVVNGAGKVTLAKQKYKGNPVAYRNILWTMVEEVSSARRESELMVNNKGALSEVFGSLNSLKKMTDFLMEIILDYEAAVKANFRAQSKAEQSSRKFEAEKINPRVTELIRDLNAMIIRVKRAEYYLLYEFHRQHSDQKDLPPVDFDPNRVIKDVLFSMNQIVKTIDSTAKLKPDRFEVVHFNKLSTMMDALRTRWESGVSIPALFNGQPLKTATFMNKCTTMLRKVNNVKWHDLSQWSWSKLVSNPSRFLFRKYLQPIGRRFQSVNLPKQ